MKISFLLFLHIGFLASTSLAGGRCTADRCAEYVTGTRPGVGVPLESRMSICSRFLESTVKPAPVIVTSTVTKYITRAHNNRAAQHEVVNTASSPTRAEIDNLIFPRAVPALAAGQCYRYDQYSSACRCWSQITIRTTALATPTITITETRFLNIACPPAVPTPARAARFPCAGGLGMCSCLKAGRGDVCVRIGARFDQQGGWGANITRPLYRTQRVRFRRGV
ncbi:hypothetical protein EDB81DRAFT_403129 [Dactylonectria macrodidyma]|uniref:Uncharacterized protein n=1 Tax=Dactylonectria macrodidyma TaxID=307937 RepID=A0A9P9FBL1_9HYPO|nr:hypothetical protein EDB81DRAFT_403129 [Dactylonectria macrodidyma]